MNTSYARFHADMQRSQTQKKSRRFVPFKLAVEVVNSLSLKIKIYVYLHEIKKKKKLFDEPIFQALTLLLSL